MKAILVIEVDDNVDLGSVYIAYDLCSKNSDGWSDVIDFGTCPLKPMPEPKPIKQEIMGEDYYIGFYGQGWNACIEEIEK